MTNLQQLQQDPAAFRNSLRIDADGEAVLLGDRLDRWQAKDFNNLDPGWRKVAGQKVDNPKLRAWLERPRGHSKTSDLAVQVMWALFASRRRLSGYAAAADRDQARLLRDAISKLISLNPWLSAILKVGVYEVKNERTGSTLEIISSDALTSYGITPDFVILDEVTHWAKRDLFDSLISSAAKRRNCMLVSICNAGFLESWQAQVRDQVLADPDWYFSALSGSIASWITQKQLDEQRRLLPELAFKRLWFNQWSAGSGDALKADDIDKSVTMSGPLEEAEEGWQYVAGVDLGLSRDASAVVVVGRHIGRVKTLTKRKRLSTTQQVMIDEGLWDEPPEDQDIDFIEQPTGKLKVAAVRLWKPEGGRRVSVDNIEQTILRLDEKFRLQSVGFDPWQAAMLRERIAKQGIPAEDVTFTGQNLSAMCTAVLEAFYEGNISMFKHPQLISDLKRLRVVEKSYGVRLDSPRTIDGHGDAATALSIAIHLATSRITLANSIVTRNLITA